MITGCSSGIGAGIAKAVLKSGDQAVVTARNKEKVQDIVGQYPDRALAVSLDVTDNSSIHNAVKEAEARFGRIDVLVNNAGYGYRAAVEEGEPEDVNTLFQTNLFGPVELIKAVLPGMRERKSGAILNVTSIAAARSAVGSAYYASSKAALEPYRAQRRLSGTMKPPSANPGPGILPIPASRQATLTRPEK